MVKTLIFICMLSVLTGCGLFARPDPEIVYKEVKVPVSQCPLSLDSIDLPSRPDLEIHNLSREDRQDIGKLSKAYKITIKQLMIYVAELEKYPLMINTVCNDLETK